MVEALEVADAAEAAEAEAAEAIVEEAAEAAEVAQATEAATAEAEAEEAAEAAENIALVEAVERAEAAEAAEGKPRQAAEIMEAAEAELIYRVQTQMGIKEDTYAVAIDDAKRQARKLRPMSDTQLTILSHAVSLEQTRRGHATCVAWRTRDGRWIRETFDARRSTCEEFDMSREVCSYLCSDLGPVDDDYLHELRQVKERSF